MTAGNCVLLSSRATLPETTERFSSFSAEEMVKTRPRTGGLLTLIFFKLHFSALLLTLSQMPISN